LEILVHTVAQPKEVDIGAQMKAAMSALVESNPVLKAAMGEMQNRIDTGKTD